MIDFQLCQLLQDFLLLLLKLDIQPLIEGALGFVLHEKSATHKVTHS